MIVEQKGEAMGKSCQRTLRKYRWPQASPRQSPTGGGDVGIEKIRRRLALKTTSVIRHRGSHENSRRPPHRRYRSTLSEPKLSRRKRPIRSNRALQEYR